MRLLKIYIIFCSSAGPNAHFLGPSSWTNTTVLIDKKLYFASEAYLRCYQRYLLNGYQMVAILQNSSVMDVWHGSKYTFNDIFYWNQHCADAYVGCYGWGRVDLVHHHTLYRCYKHICGLDELFAVKVDKHVLFLLKFVLN